MYEWYVEQLEVPYYFVLHPNKKASDFFLPEKSKPDITDSYIKSIARIGSVMESQLTINTNNMKRSKLTTPIPLCVRIDIYQM